MHRISLSSSSSRPTYDLKKLQPLNRRNRFAEQGNATLTRSRRLKAGAEGFDTLSWEASAAVERCLQHFSDSNLDAVVEYLPDAVVDRALERKRRRLSSASFHELCFHDLLDHSRRGESSDFNLNTYAQRGLVLSPPASSKLLSSLQVSGEEFLQRYQLTASSGEVMVVTFQMQLEETLAFIRGVCFRKEWFLRGIMGEPLGGELPSRPQPTCGPETVVQAQLEALRRGDLATVFGFASPRSQLLSGGYARFQTMMSNPLYQPLLGHKGAELLHTLQLDRDNAVVVVRVHIEKGRAGEQMGSRTYSWVLRLQDARSPCCANCWLTEGVTLSAGNTLPK